MLDRRPGANIRNFGKGRVKGEEIGKYSGVQMEKLVQKKNSLTRGKFTAAE
jgi:hypothetical protein